MGISQSQPLGFKGHGVRAWVRIDSKNLEQFTVFLKDPWFRDRLVNLCSQCLVVRTDTIAEELLDNTANDSFGLNFLLQTEEV
jgi:hypothetical protein